MHKPHQQTDKTLLALERESRKLRQAKWSKVPLDPPIRRGWKRCYFLTQVARQRPDAFVLERILEAINVSRTHWRRDFSPTKRNRRRQVHHLDQQLRMLETHNFGSKRSQLPEEWRAYFVRTPVLEHKSVAWKWSFRLPQLFELRIVPNLQTEAHILNPDTERRLAEIDRKLDPQGWARLNNLHGCRRRCYEGRSAKEKIASLNASHRIRSAYQGDHEAEKNIYLPADVLLCIVCRLTSPHSSRAPQTMEPSPASIQVTNPRELRLLVHAELDKLPDHRLEAARRAIQELQLRELLDQLDAEMDEAWKSGRITQESIAKAIQEHRQKHPYRLQRLLHPL